MMHWALVAKEKVKQKILKHKKWSTIIPIKLIFHTEFDLIWEMFIFNSWVLCISTSKRVLGRQFAGRNRLSDAKTTFSVTYATK